MNGKAKAKIKKVETIVEARPREGMTLQELVEKFKELGNPIKKIDEERGIILVSHTIEVKEETE